MARARNIKPGFFRNADLVELPVETRMLFIGLWTLADRDGRLEDRPRQIKMEIFPADSFDVGSMLIQLHAAGFINRYEVGLSKFIEVENFIKHQDPHYKEKVSEIPPPPGKENFIKATGVTRTQRQRILNRDGNACTSCGSTDALCIDHVFPISRGGDSSDENLQVLCSACNTKKGNKIDGEEKNSRQRRVNVEPNSFQRNDASPSEPGFLNPDVLTPDSRILIPETIGGESVQAPPTKAGQQSAVASPTPFLSTEDLKFIKTERPDLNATVVWMNFCDHYPPEKCTSVNWRKWVRREKCGPVHGVDLAPPPAVADPDSKASVESLALSLGLGRWDQLKEPWAAYKNRVKTASGGVVQ